MIRCPSCSAKLVFSAKKQRIKKLSSPKEYLYQICWVAKVDIHCPACREMITTKMPEMSLQKQIARMLPPGQGFILVTFEFDGVSVPNIYTNTEWDSAY